METREDEQETVTGGKGLVDLPEDSLHWILSKLDLESLILLGSADKQLRDIVKEEWIWSHRCKVWGKEVNLVAWRARMESSKALYRLLKSLSTLVGSWKLQSTDPRGEMIFVTWGESAAVEAWKVVPAAGHVYPHERDTVRPVTFVKFFQVVGLRDGSFRVELDSGEEKYADITLSFPPRGSSFQLQIYHELDSELTRRRVDGGPNGQRFGKRLWSVARHHFGFSSSSPVENRRYAHTRVYKRLTYDKSQPGQELAGLWHGFYGAHGWEVLTVSYTADGLILGTKVLGDVNVPAGVVSFRAHISTESAGQLPGKFYSGEGRIADVTYMNPQWVDGALVTLAGGGFLFHWRPLSAAITFHRCDLETFFRYQRAAEIQVSLTDSDSS